MQHRSHVAANDCFSNHGGIAWSPVSHSVVHIESASTQRRFAAICTQESILEACGAAPTVREALCRSRKGSQNLMPVIKVIALMDLMGCFLHFHFLFTFSSLSFLSRSAACDDKSTTLSLCLHGQGFLVYIYTSLFKLTVCTRFSDSMDIDCFGGVSATVSM